MFCIIDCGTTNTRVYLLNNKYSIIAKNTKKVGVRDTAITGTNKVLKEGIEQAIIETLAYVGATVEDLKFAIVFGMITSEIGLKEVPHLTAPVTIAQLANNIEIINDINIFPLKLPVIFIRGIKNNYGSAGIAGIRKIDFMRGEETQIAGILSKIENKLPLNVIILSSHTKLIHINDKGEIAGSITTLSGQIYEAIKKETFIGKCVKNDSDDYDNNDDDYFSEEIMQIAKDCVLKGGFLRTLLMPRFMHTLLDTTWQERKFFVDVAIAVEDMKVYDEACNELGFNLNTDLILVGHRERCIIYENLIKEKTIQNNNIYCIWDKEEIDSLSVCGAVDIIKRANIDPNLFK